MGYTPEQYMDLTQRELQASIEVYENKIKKCTSDLTVNAWLTAVWGRVNKIPKIQSVLDKIEKGSNKRVDSDLAMLEKAKQLTLLFGGNIEVKEVD